MMLADPPKLQNPESDPLYKEVSRIVEHAYAQLEDFPDEEKWVTAGKLRVAASELLFITSQALGDSSPGGTEAIWSQVRRCLSGFKAIYRFAGRQKFITLEPEIMVSLDDALKIVDKHVTDAYKQTKAANLRELEFYEKRYAMWKEMQHEN